MSISPARVKTLCNRDELSLVKASGPPELRELSLAQLKQKIGRAQRLRDKWVDQSRAQRRKTQAAQRSRPTPANARSAEKAELFTAVLAKFTSRLQSLAAPKAGSKAKPAPTPKAARRPKQLPPLVGIGIGNMLPPARGAQALNLGRRDQLSARASKKRSQFRTAGLVRVQKHTAAKNKRNQGRRDARS